MTFISRKLFSISNVVTLSFPPEKIPASVEVLEEIVRDSKKVIILNPEDRNKWDVVDSCVSLYEEAGAQVFEVNTLNQLAHFVEQM